MFSKNIAKLIPFQVAFSLNPEVKERIYEYLARVKGEIVLLFTALGNRLGNFRKFSITSTGGLMKMGFDPRRILKYFLILVIIVGVLLFGKKTFDAVNSRGSNQRLEVKGASSSQEINKEFSFPLKDAKGNLISDINYALERVEVRDEIVVKGQKATAVSGRAFLIINLKITNTYNQSIQLNTKDYIRLSVNGNEEEWLAPDIHNDPVEVQAISTKYTRVGFPINTSDTKLVLRIGEINADKEKIELELK